jgi:tryptophan synthase alpha chain
MMNRVERALNEQPPGLWPFVAAGYPDLPTTAEFLRSWGGLPIRGIEVGFPFSDPIADGPVIQEAFSRALQGGVRVADIFDTVASVRGAFDLPMLAMASASLVYRLGTEQFVERARAVGFDGLIVPDISLEEAPTLARLVTDADLCLPLLVAPTTPPDRARRISEVASGFLYYVSVQGTTGQREGLPPDLRDHVTKLRQNTGLPVLVGFGISRPQHVCQVCGFASGAIVGSAIVQKITDVMRRSTDRGNTVRHVANFVNELAGQ